MKTGDNKLEVNIKLDRSQQTRTRQWLFCPSACPRFVPPHFAAELASSLFLCAPTALSPPGETVDVRLLPVLASHSSDRTEKLHPNLPPVSSCVHPPPLIGKQSGLCADSRPGFSVVRAVCDPAAAAATINGGGSGGATPARQGFPTGETPPRPVDRCEWKTIGSSLPRARFKSGFYVMAADFQAKEEVSPNSQTFSVPVQEFGPTGGPYNKGFIHPCT